MERAQSLSLFFLTPAQGVAVSFWAVNGSSPIVPAQWDVGRVWGKAFPKSQERAGVGQAYGLGLGAEAKSSSAPFWLGKPCPSLSFPIYKMWETVPLLGCGKSLSESTSGRCGRAWQVGGDLTALALFTGNTTPM